MINHTNNEKDFLLIEVPGLGAYFMKGYATLGYADSITESQAAEIVERVFEKYFNYDLEDVNGSYSLDTAKESLASLLTSHGLKMEGTLILVKLQL